MDTLAPTHATRKPLDLGELRSLAVATTGFAALGLVAGLGSDDPASTIPAALLVDVGALALTAPALLVLHQYLGLEASPADLASAMGTAYVRAGNLALGLTPFLLFFSATSGLAAGLFALLLAVVGGSALIVAAKGMVAAHDDRTRLGVLKLRGLLLTWCGLTVLIGLRIGLSTLGGV